MNLGAASAFTDGSKVCSPAYGVTDKHVLCQVFGQAGLLPDHSSVDLKPCHKYSSGSRVGLRSLGLPLGGGGMDKHVSYWVLGRAGMLWDYNWDWIDSDHWAVSVSAVGLNLTSLLPGKWINMSLAKSLGGQDCSWIIVEKMWSWVMATSVSRARTRVSSLFT